jgi:predicted GNAT family N-acyltransferase
LKKLSIDELCFSLLESSDDISKLDCTDEDKSDPLQVNEFIHNHARTAHEAKLTAVYVVKHAKKIISCFTVSMFVIKAKRLVDKEQVKDSPIKSYPAILLGQMCVDKAYRGVDVGIHMCTFALGIASNVSKRVGCKCVVLHTNEKMEAYYEKKCKFIRAKVDPSDETVWMYRPIV